MLLIVKILLLLQFYCFASKLELLKDSFAPIPDKYRLSFSPFVGHATHEFLFQLSKLSIMDDKSFYLQDFVGLNFGRVPGSFTKSDFFPTKKPSMVAKHFSLKDHVFLLHQCYKLRQAKHDSASVLKNEILSYFEGNEDYRNSLRLDYETHMQTIIPMKEAKQLLVFLKIIGTKLECEMTRLTRVFASLNGRPLSPLDFKSFFMIRTLFLALLIKILPSSGAKI